MPYFQPLEPLEEERKKLELQQELPTYAPKLNFSREMQEQMDPSRVTEAAPETSHQRTDGEGSGKFVNFSRYFEANRSAAQNTANGLAGSIDQKGQEAQTSLGDAQSRHEQAVKDGTPQQRNVAIVDPRYATPTVRPRYGSPASEGAQNIGRKQAETLAANATYKGPSDLTGDSRFTALSQQVKDAQGRANATATAHGRQTLLTQQHGRAGGYSQGMSRFDSALTNRAGGSRFQELRGKYGGLTRALEQANIRAAEQAQAARGTADQVAGGYKKMVEDYDAGADARAAAAQATQAQEAAAKAAEAQRAWQDRDNAAKARAQQKREPREYGERSPEATAAAHGLTAAQYAAAGEPYPISAETLKRIKDTYNEDGSAK